MKSNFYRVPAVVLSVLFGASIAAALASAATTISTNIQTDGTLSVTGTSMLTGNVGINQTNPSYNLDVSGLGHFTGLVDAANFVATSTTANSTFAGNVGIGTSSPTSYLDVAFNGGGGISVTSFRNSSLGGNLALFHARGTQSAALPLSSNDTAGNIYFEGMQSTGAFAIVSSIEGKYLGDNSGLLRFSVNNTPDEAMRIVGGSNGSPGVGIGYGASTVNQGSGGALQVNGRVGVGTTSPATMLQVTNGAAATTTVTVGSLGLTSSKACVNMNRADGGPGSFYISAAGAMVVESNYCR